MGSKTLLQYVQDALESMGSDSVSSISSASSTEEAIVVANIAKQTYEFMQFQYDWPHQKKLVQLEGLSDTNTPNYLKIPDNVSELVWFKYNNVKIPYTSPEKFLDTSDLLKKAFDDGDTTISKVTDLGGVDIYIKNNIQASSYTSFDNEHLVFDSYDNAIQTTMHSSLSSAYAVLENAFVLSDTFVPFLPNKLEPLFQAEINAAAHKQIKQQQSLVDEKRSLQGRSKMKTKADRVNRKVRQGFGRK